MQSNKNTAQIRKKGRRHTPLVGVVARMGEVMVDGVGEGVLLNALPEMWEM